LTVHNFYQRAFSIRKNRCNYWLSTW